MPIREFDCKKCGHTQDEIVGSNIPDDLECEKCGGALILSTRPTIFAAVTGSKAASASKPADSTPDSANGDKEPRRGDEQPSTSNSIEVETVLAARTAKTQFVHRETGETVSATLTVTESTKTGERDVKILIKSDQPQGMTRAISLREGIGKSDTAN